MYGIYIKQPEPAPKKRGFVSLLQFLFFGDAPCRESGAQHIARRDGAVMCPRCNLI